MRSIFWRLFFWFWLATGIMLGLNLLLTQWVSAQRMASLDDLDPRQLSIEACHVLGRSGTAGLSDWIESRQHEHPNLFIYVLDAAGQDIAGQEPPQRLHDWFVYSRSGSAPQSPGVNLDASTGCRPSEAQAVQVSSAQSYWTWRETPDLVATDGQRYMLLFDPMHYPPIALEEFQHLGGGYFPAVLLLCLSLSGCLCGLLARHFSRPLRMLQRGAREIANGNLQQRVAGDFSARSDELGVLARDFDLMAERVEALVQSHERLLRDVSHELRSPLTRLQLAVTLARRGDEHLPRNLERIEREGERLESLIAALLRLSAMRSGDCTLARQHMDLRVPLRWVVANARFEAQAEGKTVNYSEPEQAMPVRGDAEQLASALENIVRNGLRFTPPGASLCLRIERQDECLQVCVDDQGPGVPEEALPRIFEPFYRVSSSRERKSGGAGLGLTIAMGIAQAHGGHLAARNRPQGGLCVTLTLAAES
ncbi:ATP-binding protein [Pseudomonas sp. LRF_L74]|uniref:ATP-binding protein n=1 Tax=Pseudomonas sp. LRF_L74 TaxID=3369422 RepID=UPI003F64372C